MSEGFWRIWDISGAPSVLQADDSKIVTLITDWHAGTAAELRAPRAEPQIKNGRMDMSWIMHITPGTD